jgi:hypothetical protein
MDEAMGKMTVTDIFMEFATKLREVCPDANIESMRISSSIIEQIYMEQPNLMDFVGFSSKKANFYLATGVCRLESTIKEELEAAESELKYAEIKKEKAEKLIKELKERLDGKSN